MVTPCRSCRRGPLQFDRAWAVRDDEAGPIRLWRISVLCTACTTTATFTFQLPKGTEPDSDARPPLVNPVGKASRIIDVAQWLTLFRMVTEEAGRESDRLEARELGIEAAQCLEEALRFYDEPGNDLPSEGAFFNDESLKRFRENPQEFSKQRLIELRSRLPVRSASRPSVSSSEPPTKTRWWRRRK